MPLINDKVKRKPIILYHYTTQDGLLGIISRKHIWATNIHYLNDATEFGYAINLTLETLHDKEKESCWVYQEFSHRIMNILKSNDRLSLYVISFSEVGDLLSQWRAYCSSSNGFSIGFGYGKILSLGMEQGFVLRNCVYDREDQKKAINQILEDAYKILACELKGELLLSPEDRATSFFMHKFVDVAPFFKDPSFSEEKEWRLVSLKNILNSDLQFRSGKSMVIPYTEVDLVNKKNELPFAEIIVGPTPNMDLSQISLKYLTDSNNCNCVLKPSVVPYRAW